MSIIRIGATKDYSDNWELAFGKGKQKSTASAAKPAKKKTASARKKSGAKKSKRK